MSPTKRLSRWAASAARWAASAALASLLVAVPMAAAQGEPDPGSQGTPSPQIDSYQPFPAAWGQPITIHGSHLVPWQEPSTQVQAQPVGSQSGFKQAVADLALKFEAETGTSGPAGPNVPVPEGPTPVLKVGSVGDEPSFVIPASDIESWTSSEIQIKKLSGGRAGAYWIAIYQNGVRVSNLNRTLLFPQADPNPADSTLQPGGTSSSSDDEPLLTAGHAPVQEPPPSQWLAYVVSYQPTIVGAGDEVQIIGGFAYPGEVILMYGAGNTPLGMIHPHWILEWSDYKIRFKNGFLPTGVYWIAVFTMSNGLELVSNLVWTLQVTEDAPPLPSGSNAVQLQEENWSSPNPGRTSVLQHLPSTPGTGAPVQTLSPRPGTQRAPRVKILRPAAEPRRSLGGAVERKAVEVKKQRQPVSRTSTAPMAPVPEEAPERTLRPAGKQPSLQQQRVR